MMGSVDFLYTDWYTNNKEINQMDNREMLLDTALSLFYEKGYDAVGVQEIVDLAGVTKPTLYYYFGSKRGLLEALLYCYFESIEQKLQSAAVHDADMPQVLYRVAEAFFEGACGNPRFYLLMLSLFYSGRKSDGFQTVYPLIQRYYRLFVHIFEEAEGELGNMNGRQQQFATGFIGILHHHLMMAAGDREDLSGLEISGGQIYELVRQFMYGIYS